VTQTAETVESEPILSDELKFINDKTFKSNYAVSVVVYLNNPSKS